MSPSTCCATESMEGSGLLVVSTGSGPLVTKVGGGGPRIDQVELTRNQGPGSSGN